MEKWGALVGMLVMAAVFALGSDIDSRGDQVRALREVGGVEVVGQLKETFVREHVISPGGSKRPTATRRVEECPVYTFRDSYGRSHTYKELQHCDVSDWSDTVDLIYHPDAPDAALNNTDEALGKESTWAWVLRIGGTLGGLACVAFLGSTVWPRVRARLGLGD